MSPTLTALRKLIIICENYGDDFELLFNPDKCYLIIFSCCNSQFLCNITLKVCGKEVKVVNKEIHLGNIISNGDSLVEMKDAMHGIKSRTLTIVNNFANISFKSKIKMFTSQCTALYGAQLWDIEDRCIEAMNIAWRKSIRFLLGLHPRTKSYILPYIAISLMNFRLYLAILTLQPKLAGRWPN